MLQQHEKVMKLSSSSSPAALSHCAVTWQAAALMVTRGTQSTLHTQTHTHTVPQKCCRQSVLHNGNMFPSRDPESLQEEKPLCCGPYIYVWKYTKSWCLWQLIVTTVLKNVKKSLSNHLLSRFRPSLDFITRVGFSHFSSVSVLPECIWCLRPAQM